MRSAGLYIHFPFCERLCPYCDFAVKVRKVIPEKEYTDAIIRELKSESNRWKSSTFRTLYFGGGTPSLWTSSHLLRVLEALDANLSLDLEETTIEANPQDINEANLSRWKSHGIGRVSLGVQSFDDNYLKALGRNHDGKRAEEALANLKAYGFNVSADLIFAGPKQTLSSFEKDLRTLVEYVDHVSAYALTVEENTQFWKRRSEGRLSLPEDDEESAFYDLRDSFLEEVGFERYEVSSFSRNLESRANHNSAYWLGRPYLGLGIGAHSMFFSKDEGFLRYSNTRKLKSYYSNYLEGREREVVSDREHWFERMFLIARTRFPFSPKEMFSSFPSLEDWILTESEAVFDSFDSDYVEKKSGFYRMTSRGLDISDSVGKALAEKIQ